MKRNILSYIIAFALILPVLISCSDENANKHDDDHFEAEGIIIRDATKGIFMKIYQGAFDTDYSTSFILSEGTESDHFDISFIDDHGNEIHAPENDEYTLDWTLDNPELVELERHEEDEWEFHLDAKTKGTTYIELRVIHGGHADFRTPKIPIIIE
jgi:hypothetical protein